SGRLRSGRLRSGRLRSGRAARHGGAAHVAAAGEGGAVLDDQLGRADVALDHGRVFEHEALLDDEVALDAPADLGRSGDDLALDPAVGHDDRATVHLDVAVDRAADVDVATGAERAFDDGVLADD